jgi:hypothetical protein
MYKNLRQVGYFQDLYQDARSAKNKIQSLYIGQGNCHKLTHSNVEFMNAKSGGVRKVTTRLVKVKLLTEK